MPSKQAIDFFYKNSGFGYDPKKETPSQGKKRGARLLARAEELASSLGWTFTWKHEEEDCEFEDMEGIDEILYVVLKDENGEVVGSLGCISFGKNNVENRKYGRVVEAEVALEALSEKGLIK